MPEQPVHFVADIPLPGGTSRFDYQSFDPVSGRLYIAHMGAGELVVFDTRAARVVGTIADLPGITGVLAVPRYRRIYASAAGDHRVVIIDDATLRTVSIIRGIAFPDGLAFAPEAAKVFVSDELGRQEVVIDARTSRLRRFIPLDGQAGNTQYDSLAQQILVAIQTRNELVTLDPETERVVGRFQLSGADHPHGLLIDAERRLAFVANEGNHQLLVVDLRTMRTIAQHTVGTDPDVLGFDPGLRRLYVASESGVITIFRELDDGLEPLGAFTAPRAHSVSVNPLSHEVYVPLADVGGRPVLRILAPP